MAVTGELLRMDLYKLLGLEEKAGVPNNILTPSLVPAIRQSSPQGTRARGAVFACGRLVYPEHSYHLRNPAHEYATVPKT
ncbi:hypothetical protein STEG23_020410 [Scotinomys teguina]